MLEVDCKKISIGGESISVFQQQSNLLCSWISKRLEKLQDSLTTETDLECFTDIGGNPSAEGGDEEGADDAAQQVDDVPHSFRLQSLGEYQKPAYRDHLKGREFPLRKFLG